MIRLEKLISTLTYMVIFGEFLKKSRNKKSNNIFEIPLFEILKKGCVTFTLTFFLYEKTMARAQCGGSVGWGVAR